MAKKKYRIYKAGGAQQGRVMNPTAQFLARAQKGMQQPSEEEMAMMQQQAMQQQQGQPQMQQQGGQDQMMQQLVAAIGQAMQNGDQPEEVIAKLLQDQVEPQMVVEALVELGMPMEEVDQLMSSVIQQLEGGQEQGQPSEEEMMAMQQQQMAEQAPPQEQLAEEAPMSKGGYVKKKLKKAQEGMQQNGVKASNTNLAAEDDVNYVSTLIDFSKNNILKNQYEQEYDQMQSNQGMMPEARLGREARQERREIRQDERTDRTEMRQTARTARQANRLANRAVRQVASPFGRVPGFSAYSPSPFMGSSIRLEDVERGLFGRLKNFKMSIDGMGFPARFSEGMFMNAMHNPYGMPAGQSRIVRKLTTPGEVVDRKVVEKNKEIKFNQKTDAEGSGGSSDAFKQYFANDMQERLNRIKTGKIGSLESPIIPDTDVVDTDAGGLPPETGGGDLTPVKDADKLEVTDDVVNWWLIGGVATTLVVGDMLLTTVALKRAMANGAKTVKEAAAMEGTKATAEQVKQATKGPTFRERMRTKVQGKPQMRNPLSGKFQAKPQTVRKYAGQKSANILRQGYKYGMKKPWQKIVGPIIRGLSRGRIKMEDGGYIDMMDQDYGNPDLYRFTGGGDYDYFADGGYYEDGGYAQYEDVNDPYMPYMQDGGYIPRANEGMYVDPSRKTYKEYLGWHNEEPVEAGYSRAAPLSEDEWMTEQGFKSQVNPNSGNTTKDLYNSLSDAQKEMYKKEYQRRQQSGSGQRGYGMQGYGRRGLFNTVMGINAPGAIQRRQYLTQMAGPTYADGTPVIGGALPEGYHLRTGKAEDGEQGMEYLHNNLRDRLFRGKDAEGNRNPRLPKKSIKYYFEGPNDTTPSLAGGDNAISNFKPTPTPNVAEEESESEAKGKSKKVKGRTVKGMTPLGEDKFIDRKGRLRSPDRVRGKRSSEEVGDISERMPLANDRVTPNLPVNVNRELIQQMKRNFPQGPAVYDESRPAIGPAQAPASQSLPPYLDPNKDGRGMENNPDYSDFVYGGYAQNGEEVQGGNRPPYNTLYPASMTRPMNPNAGPGQDYEMYDPYFSKARNLDLPEFEQRVLEPEPKAKAKAKASKKKYNYNFDNALSNYEKQSFLHEFDNSHTNSDNFARFKMTPEMMDERGIGDGFSSKDANRVRSEYQNSEKKMWGNENILIPRVEQITNWAKAERNKIEKAWQSGSIDMQKKKQLENKILGRQLDETQRIEDNYYDSFNNEQIGLEKPSSYHNYNNTKQHDAGEFNDKKGIFYSPSKRKSRAQVFVDGTDEGGAYTWEDDGTKVYLNRMQYGGYQEGQELYMNSDEISQFMAAGGQIEFL